jgi:predicted DNA-binding transcriptional regulator AlpA
MSRLNPNNSFDALPDVALIQLRPLLHYKVLPYSATTVWRLCRTGKFPRPIKVSPGITAWRVADIRKYLDQVGSKSTEWGAA